MDTEPLLAAVVIARNEERFIERCLRAVLGAVASFPGTDVVFVDSCSSDKTVQLARRLPVRIVELRPDAPLSPALGRLVGQHVSRSRYLLFVDGDTEIEAAWLAESVRYLESHPRVAGVDGKLPEVYYEDDRVVGRAADFLRGLEIPTEVEWLGGNAVYRRAALESVGSFNPFLASYEEIEMAERLRRRDYAVVRLPIVLGTHHTGPRGSLQELSRMYRENLIKGYGQTLRAALRQGTFWAHARRMKRYLQFQVFVALGLVMFVLSAILGDWRLAAAWCASVVIALGSFMLRSRSLRKPFWLIADWAIWSPPMVAGFLERPKDPASIEPAAMIARELDCRPA